ncbi:NADPH-dependent FMN reductase [Sulfobacillus harzensis]|uniref:NAD(P)H-dependent oxidoreductase n=1 Tax=Sulfobacillus harzensis TaxID=2729629 RepID=A0A7Y0L1S9_9FIRM|nr:NAD(P)H-dependent oxidoreductase [Sulfobacillus harzensis]NMP21717.1 NAD(P)H-dependent oxidoreductase [Sulfobacillus harzensis]
MTPTLLVIIGSTRPTRVGSAVGQWFVDHARTDGRFTTEVADLAEMALPLLDEPDHPRVRQYRHPHTQAWSKRVETADAVVFITPEYNYGVSAPLKNAIDYLHHEWQIKPAAFVSYGGVSGGTRAVQMLKQIVTTVKMVPLCEAVVIPWVEQFLDDDKHFCATPALEEAASVMLNELLFWAKGLKAMRDQRAAL